MVNQAVTNLRELRNYTRYVAIPTQHLNGSNVLAAEFTLLSSHFVPLDGEVSSGATHSFHSGVRQEAIRPTTDITEDLLIFNLGQLIAENNIDEQVSV